MNCKEIIVSVMRYYDTTQDAMAKMFGMFPQNFGHKIMRKTLRVDDLMSMLDTMGIDVQLVDRKTGDVIPMASLGDGRRIKKMINRVIYDTDRINAVANSFYFDGENEYVDGHAYELYKTDDGKYLLAEYSNISGIQDRLSMIPEEEAQKFIQKYGTALHRSPKE